MANLTKYEVETVINYNAAEQRATVYTRDKSVMRRLDRLMSDCPDIYKLLNQTDIGKIYFMPKSYVNYCKSRVLGSRQGEQARQRISRLDSNDN